MTVCLYRLYCDIHDEYFSSDRRFDRATRRKIWRSKTDNIQDRIEVSFKNISSSKSWTIKSTYSTRVESLISLNSTSFIRRSDYCSCSYERSRQNYANPVSEQYDEDIIRSRASRNITAYERQEITYWIRRKCDWTINEIKIEIRSSSKLKSICDTGYLISTTTDTTTNTKDRRVCLHKEIKMSMRNDWYMNRSYSIFTSYLNRCFSV